MSSTHEAQQSVVHTEFSPGTVHARVLVPASVLRVWSAITRRDVVSMWFGDLSADVGAGAKLRLDFGDGDFFAIENVRARPPRKLEYCWRFLGTGPDDEITWNLEERGENCLLTVTDQQPSRDQKACTELAEGWTDFLERLEKYMRTGDMARYDWRRDFDGAADLPVPASEVLRVLQSLRGRALWAPFEDALLEKNSSSPTAIAITAVQWKNPSLVEFQLRAKKWASPTACRLEVVAKPTGSAIVVRHTGWSDISSDPVFCMTERRRFCGKWISVLEQMQTLLLKTAATFVQ